MTEKQLANLIPAKKGEIRNPAGKPKGTIHISTRIQNMLNDDEFTTTMIQKDGKKVQFKGNPAEAIIKTAILKAMSGDSHWAEWLVKHGYGSLLRIADERDPVDEILEKYGLRQVENETPKQIEGNTNNAGEASEA